VYAKTLEGLAPRQSREIFSSRQVPLEKSREVERFCANNFLHHMTAHYTMLLLDFEQSSFLVKSGKQANMYKLGWYIYLPWYKSCKSKMKTRRASLMSSLRGRRLEGGRVERGWNYEAPHDLLAIFFTRYRKISGRKRLLTFILLSLWIQDTIVFTVIMLVLERKLVFSMLFSTFLPRGRNPYGQHQESVKTNRIAASSPCQSKTYMSVWHILFTAKRNLSNSV